VACGSAVSQFCSAFNKSGLFPRLIKADGSGEWHAVVWFCSEFNKSGLVLRLIKVDGSEKKSENSIRV
jgi:hypothetical protein